jgi:hypothetical protein
MSEQKNDKGRVECMQATMTSNALYLSDGLREVKMMLTPEQFSQWTQAEVGMDADTVEDFMNFKAGYQLTGRMMQHFERLAATKAMNLNI